MAVMMMMMMMMTLEQHVYRWSHEDTQDSPRYKSLNSARCSDAHSW